MDLNDVMQSPNGAARLLRSLYDEENIPSGNNYERMNFLRSLMPNCQIKREQFQSSASELQAYEIAFLLHVALLR